jgi:membrane-bound serine protease (ClpP class)
MNNALQLPSMLLAALQIRDASNSLLFDLLPILAPLLLLGGLLAGYISIKTPGMGVPETVAVVCFTLFFALHYAAGVAGWEVAIVFLVGVLLVLSELFLHPGTILPGLCGAALMAGAIIWAMIDRRPSDPWWPTGSMLLWPVINLFIAVLGATVAAYFLGKYLPQSRAFRWLVLAETTPHGQGPLIPEAPADVLTGAKGTARTMLRPSGKAEIAGRLLDVVTQGDFIEEGHGVRVIAVEGVRVVVAPA